MSKESGSGRDEMKREIIRKYERIDSKNGEE